ncbi:unnamed protein product, partial [Arabidopsis lyrata]
MNNYRPQAVACPACSQGRHC